jgi:hypothetical protein
MKKRFLFIAALFVFSIASYSQVDTRHFIFSLAPEVSVPIGDFKQINKTGFGLNIITQFSIADKLKLLASLGGGQHHGKTFDSQVGYSDTYPSVSILRLRAGLKYFLSQGLFIAGNLGVAHTFQEGESKYGLSYAPQLGYELGGVDVFARYDVVNVKLIGSKNIQAITFCLGYRF